MTTYRKLPVPVEAIQFTGDNWAEMHAFTGHRKVDGRQMDVFNQIGTYLAEWGDDAVGADGELWEKDHQVHRPVCRTDWIVKDGSAFVVCTDEVFQSRYITESEFESFIDRDLVGVIPVLTMDAPPARKAGRIYMSLLMTRPGSEAEMLADWVTTLIAENNVLNERFANDV